MSNMLCKECVNFLMHNKDICHCDYEYWENTQYKDALLLCGEMFECKNFEELFVANKKVSLEVHNR
jgi:hypothetical protein